MLVGSCTKENDISQSKKNFSFSASLLDPPLPPRNIHIYRCLHSPKHLIISNPFYPRLSLPLSHTRSSLSNVETTDVLDLDGCRDIPVIIFTRLCLKATHTQCKLGWEVRGSDSFLRLIFINVIDASESTMRIRKTILRIDRSHQRCHLQMHQP